MSQTVFITGGASGIGLHLSKVFYQKGWRVFTTDVDYQGLKKAFEGKSDERLLIRKLDVRRQANWEKAMLACEESFGAPDLMLNVAGYLRPGYIAELESAEIDLHLDINVKGLMLGTLVAAKSMEKSGSGHIINFGSLASLTPVPGLSLYAASKFAVRGFALSTALELKEKNISSTLIMPDAVDTPMLDAQIDHESAALTFSGLKTLSVKDIEDALFDHILVKKPLEYALPSSRGILAKAVSLYPGVANTLEPLLRKIGKKKQEGIRNKRG